MKISALTSWCFLILLSSVAAAQQAPQQPPPQQPPRPAGTAGTAVLPAVNGTAPKPAPAADTSADYRLVTGDKLRVEVYKDPQLSQSLQIRPDGKITLPLVGDLAAAGKTSSELRDVITTALSDYVKNPAVTVIVVETMPQMVYVMGEVNAPGSFPVKGEISIVQALSLAGGFKDFANKKSIRILRPGPKGTTTMTFNYNDAIKGETKMLFLKPGDTVIVPD